MNVTFFRNKRFFLLCLLLMTIGQTRSMVVWDLYTSFAGASWGNALGMAASLIKHHPDAPWSLGIGSFLGPERMKSFINYSPSSITQRNMLGISLMFNTYLFYKQKFNFELPGIFDKQPLYSLFSFSSKSIEVGCGSRAARTFEDALSHYDRQGLMKMELVEFCILWGYACATLAYQGKLSFKQVQYSALCAFMDVVPSLTMSFLSNTSKKVTNEMQVI